MKKQSENSGEGTKKLTDEELDAVVGGFNIFRFFMGLIDAVSEGLAEALGDKKAFG